MSPTLYLRATLLTPGKPLVVLRSYSPASVANSVFLDDRRVKLKAKADYVAGARRACETVGATHFVPFASQVFFARTDSQWANEFRVMHEDLEAHWGGGPVVLCRPFARMDLGTRESASGYDDVQRVLDPERAAIVVKRESEEAAFTPPAELADRLKRYLDGVALLPLLFRRGIGWRLATSETELFYATRGRTISRAIPRDHDFVITLPDKVLAEALTNGVLSDLGITMFVRVDTKVRPRLAYSAFLLMGLRDYGYFDGVRSFARFIRFYVPYLFPALWRVSPTALLGRRRRSRALDLSHDRRAAHPAAEPSRTG